MKRNFEKYELLDERVIFLKGFFAETTPAAPIEKLALMRLDGDMYEFDYGRPPISLFEALPGRLCYHQRLRNDPRVRS